MSAAKPSPRPPFGNDIGLREFVVMMAAIMGLHACGIDAMLPALPHIGASLEIDSENHRQWIVSAYMLGFGSSQILFGPMADRFGRRTIMVTSLAFYGLMSLVSCFAASFALMIGARVLQGIAGAASRVIIVSIVRDRFEGATMARVMSLTSMIFFAVPILAPSLGQLILTFAPWRAIFLVLALYGFLLSLWTGLRLGETLDPLHRRTIGIADLRDGFRTVVTHRASLGYTLAQTVNFGGILGFIMSSQQLFSDAFGEADIFAYLFALSATGLACAAFINSRIVQRFGTRMVSHSALIVLVAITMLHLAWALAIGDTLISFLAFQILTMICTGLTNSNFNALAMESMGRLAGMASSVQGTISTVGATVTAMIIGQHFDGTALPVTIGFAITSVTALTIVLFTERGTLFHWRPSRGNSAQ